MSEGAAVAIDFRAMSAQEAKAFMRAWVDTAPDRRRWLANELAADGRKPLRDDTHSLLEVAGWLGERVRLRAGVVLGGAMPDLSGVDPQAVPSWFDGSAAGAWMFDDWSNWAIDAAALNFGHVVTSQDPEVRWSVARERNRGFIDQNRPALLRSGSQPVNPVGVHVGALLTLRTLGTPAADSVREALARLRVPG